MKLYCVLIYYTEKNQGFWKFRNTVVRAFGRPAGVQSYPGAPYKADWGSRGPLSDSLSELVGLSFDDDSDDLERSWWLGVKGRRYGWAQRKDFPYYLRRGWLEMPISGGTTTLRVA